MWKNVYFLIKYFTKKFGIIMEQNFITKRRIEDVFYCFVITTDYQKLKYNEKDIFVIQ